MSKKIMKKLGTILLATLASSMLALLQTANFASTANAAGTCPDNIDFMNTTAVKTAAKDMKGEDLDACIKEAGTAAKDCDAVADKPTCDKLKASYDTFFFQKGANTATDPIEKYVKANGINEMFETLCLEGETVNYSVTIEEVIDSDLTNNPNIINCTRNTYCVQRTDKLGIECVTTLRKTENGGCSAEAKTKADDPLNKASLYCQQVQVLKSDSGTDLLFLYIGTIYRWAASVIGIIAVLVMVISGIQISAAAGEQQAITNAKTRIFQSIGGLVLLFLSGIILYTINPTFFTGG